MSQKTRRSRAPGKGPPPDQKDRPLAPQPTWQNMLAVIAVVGILAGLSGVKSCARDKHADRDVTQRATWTAPDPVASNTTDQPVATNSP